MKYQKKPEIVDAFKWTGGPDQTEDPTWIVNALRAGTIRINSGNQLSMEIDTRESVRVAYPGDYILRDPTGEIWPMKQQLFELLYEPLPESVEPTIPEFPVYDQEIWSVPKDTIYLATAALENGLAHTQELLAQHDISLGCTTRKNALTALAMENDIWRMERAIAALRAAGLQK